MGEGNLVNSQWSLCGWRKLGEGSVVATLRTTQKLSAAFFPKSIRQARRHLLQVCGWMIHGIGPNDGDQWATGSGGPLRCVPNGMVLMEDQLSLVNFSHNERNCTKPVGAHGDRV